MANITISELRPIELKSEVNNLSNDEQKTILGGADIIYVDECGNEKARVILDGPDTIITIK